MTADLPRIIHVASGREWRGGQRQVHLLARELHRRGIDQIVVTTEGSRLAISLAADGVPTRAVGWHRGLSVRALVATMAEARRAPAILHAHDAHALILAGLAAPLSGNRFVVTRRVDFHLRRPGFWVRAARVIAISDAVAAILREDGIPPERITVVNSAIDLAATAAVSASSIRTDLGIPATGPLAVSVAALVEHKDHDTLLRAAALIHRDRPDLHWALAGSGPLRDRLETQARDLGLLGHIHFLGTVDRPLELIKSADLFVLTSVEEGLGTSVLDAMALGVPVVATRAGGIPEMLDGGAGLLAPVRDPDSVARAVTQLLSDQSVRQSVVAEATRRVARFDAGGMAEGVLSVYRSVCLER